MELNRDRDIRIAHSRDASGLELVPDFVLRPSTAVEVAEAIREIASSGSTITAAGSQTSLTGSSITGEGALMSLLSMSSIVDVDPVRRIVRVEPGVTIGDLNRALEEYGLLFAPDPTSENDATIGGAIACNASGARTLHYGATRNHVEAVRVAHADGCIRSYTRTHPEKNCVGYFMAQDPVDWFVGSEGTLGIVVEAELKLVERPGAVIGLATSFRSRDDALGFVIAARRSARSPLCLELFDYQASLIAAEQSGRHFPEGTQAVIYLEDDAKEDALIDEALDHWLAIAEKANAMTDDIRVFQGAGELRDARAIRHAVPATMNERGARFRSAGGRKVSTDWAVPFQLLKKALRESELAVQRHDAPLPVTYGHAGNGHPHQNFVAENADQLAKINAAVGETLERIVALGGTVSAEHGLGKLKRHWMPLQMSKLQIEVMRQIKHTLDPQSLFAPGNIFES